MSHQASGCITSDIACKWHGPIVVAVPIQPTSGSEIVKKDKFFASHQVRMSWCRIEPQDTLDLTFDARSAVCAPLSCKSNPPVRPHEESKRKFFHQSKFECLGVASGFAMQFLWPHMHAAQTGGHSWLSQTSIRIRKSNVLMQKFSFRFFLRNKRWVRFARLWHEDSATCRQCQIQCILGLDAAAMQKNLSFQKI